MRLQLNPQELGAIEVEMVSGSRGIQVTFFAEQASTGRLLETQLNQLRDSLVDSGVQLSGLNIGQHNTHGQKGGTFSQQPDAAPWPNEIFVEESRTMGTETYTSERRFGQSSEVDYRI
jgi:flagellar hook-length control protein FliK